MSDFMIFLNKSHLDSFEISDDDLVMLVNLFPLCYLQHIDGENVLCANDFFYRVYGTIDVPAKVRKLFHTTLDSLILLGTINAKKLDQNTYLIDREKLFEHSADYFVILSWDDVRKIMRSECNHKSALLRFYCNLMGTRIVGKNHSGKVGNRPMEELADINECSVATVNKYNHELEKLKVIYVRRASKNISDHLRLTNAYGRYEDKEAVDRYAAEHNYGATKCNGNWLRKVSAMYNRYVADSDHTFDAELFSMCKQYNEEMERRQRLQPGTDFIDKKKDLSVFH